MEDTIIKTIKFQSTVFKCVDCEKMCIRAKGESSFCKCGSHNVMQPYLSEIDTSLDIEIKKPEVTILNTEYPKEAKEE